MDFETPADAWYTYVAVSIVSVALAGLAVGVATGPPPDAQQAANAIEGATGSEYTASAAYDHDADRVTINRRTVTMENEHGTTHASFSYGIVVPVNGHDRLERLARGASFEDAYRSELADPETHAVESFTAEVEDAFDDNTGEPLSANGELRARQVVVDPDVDEYPPLTETATVEATETGITIIPYTTTGIREVTLDYDGLEERAVEFTIEGEYIIHNSFTERETATFGDGSGSRSIEITTNAINQPAAEPVAFSVEFAGDDYPTQTWTNTNLRIGDRYVWTNEIEREADFDHDHSIVGLNAGGNYHVTLVIV